MSGRHQSVASCPLRPAATQSAHTRELRKFFLMCSTPTPGGRSEVQRIARREATRPPTRGINPPGSYSNSNDPATPGGGFQLQPPPGGNRSVRFTRSLTHNLRCARTRGAAAGKWSVTASFAPCPHRVGTVLAQCSHRACTMHSAKLASIDPTLNSIALGGHARCCGRLRSVREAGWFNNPRGYGWVRVGFPACQHARGPLAGALRARVSPLAHHTPCNAIDA